METFTLKAKTWNAWRFTISGDIGELISYKTITGGTHIDPFPTWMDNDEFDFEQTYALKKAPDSPWHPICNKMEVRFLMLSLIFPRITSSHTMKPFVSYETYNMNLFVCTHRE